MLLMSKTEVLGEKLVLLPLWPPRAPHEWLVSNRGLRAYRPANNLTNHNMALDDKLKTENSEKRKYCVYLLKFNVTS